LHRVDNNECVTSINQVPAAPARSLPDFRNLGVLLRLLVIVNLASLLAAVLRTATWEAVPDDFMALSVSVQPVLLLALVALYLAGPWLRRQSYARGAALVLLTAALAALLVHGAGLRLPGAEEQPDLLRFLVVSLACAALLLGYFDLRGRALSPALTEARLQALQARIRPHFLFNSINAVLSIIRSDPRRAEEALEDMAELFRAVMSDSRRLSPLKREVELCRQYLQLESLRLPDRLIVEWHLDKMPEDALVPPLVLQPLVENAVYHGIEPAAEAGVVSVNVYKSGNEVHMVLKNPYRGDSDRHVGNRMALANIRERLALHFDAEASLETRAMGQTYQVHITLPYLTEAGR
jgi:two-component system sensor histidine kinase AlgZ